MAIYFREPQENPLAQLLGTSVTSGLEGMLQGRQQSQTADLFEKLKLPRELAIMNPQYAKGILDLIRSRETSETNQAIQSIKEQQQSAKEAQEKQSFVNDILELRELGKDLGVADVWAPGGAFMAPLKTGTGLKWSEKRSALMKHPLVKKYGIALPDVRTGKMSDDLYRDAIQRVSGVEGLQEQQGIQPGVQQGMQPGAETGAPPEMSQMQQQLNELMSPQPEQPQEQFFQPPQEQGQESILGAIPRNIAAMGASGLTGLADLPMSILNLAIDPIQKWRESKLPSPEEMEQYTAGMPEFLQKQAREAYGEAKAGTVTRTAEETIKEPLAQVLPEGYLEPRNEYEKLGQDFSKTLGTLAFPIPGVGATKPLATLLKKAGVAGVGEVSKFLTKKLGYGETAQEVVKIGTMLASGYGFNKSVKNTAKDMYNRGRDLISPNLNLPSQGPLRTIKFIEDGFTNVGDRFTKGKEAVRSALGSLESIILGKNVNAKDLLAFKQGIGTRISELGNIGDKKQTSYWLRELGRRIGNTIKGSDKVPKEARTLLHKADQIWSGLSKADQAIDYVRNLPGLKASSGGLRFFGLGQVIRAGKAGLREGSALGANALHAARHLLTKPAIREQYLRLIKAGLRNASPAAVTAGIKLARLTNDANLKLERRR